MIETGSEIIDAVISNPMEAMFIVFAIFFGYKYAPKSQRELRHFSHKVGWQIGRFFHFLEKCVDNRWYSFSGLNVEMLDRTLEIIKYNKDHNWTQREIIRNKTGMSEIEVAQIIHALVNQGKIDWNSDHELVLLSALGSGTKTEVIS